MKTNKLILLSVLILSGCQWRTSSLSSSSFSSSIPIPSDEFLPYIDGRKFLIEKSKIYLYATTSVSDLNELPLSKINYPTNQVLLTTYAVNEALPSQFANQTITFDATQQPDARDTLALMVVGEVGKETDTLSLLNQLTTSDEVFNQQTTVFKERNLSSAFFESDYYWFNHYVLEETMVVQRYPNQIIYGTGNQIKTFQTDVSIPVGIQYQLYADASTIYEIRDETYPSNFFGARDTKFETIRTQDNFKRALTLGPATEILGLWNLLERGFVPVGLSLQEPLTNYQQTIEMKKLSSDTIEFSLRLYRGESWLDALESFEFKASLTGQTWQEVVQHYLLWEPSVTA
jgi:hypothetical protein